LSYRGTDPLVRPVPAVTHFTMRLASRPNLLTILLGLFVGVPLLDTMTLVLVGRYIGFWPTVAMVIVSGVIGAQLARRQGLAAWRALQADLAAGRVPAQGLLDCVLILIAGGMMICPGFVTDIAAILLLLPPTRTLVKRRLRGRLERLIQARLVRPGPTGW
jgi:UPF0716 protein FxsA